MFHVWRWCFLFPRYLLLWKRANLQILVLLPWPRACFGGQKTWGCQAILPRDVKVENKVSRTRCLTRVYFFPTISGSSSWSTRNSIGMSTYGYIIYVPGPSNGCQMDGKVCHCVTPFGFEHHLLEGAGMLLFNVIHLIFPVFSLTKTYKMGNKHLCWT